MCCGDRLRPPPIADIGLDQHLRLKSVHACAALHGLGSSRTLDFGPFGIDFIVAKADFICGPRASQEYLKSTWTLNHRFLKVLNGRDVRIVASGMRRLTGKKALGTIYHLEGPCVKRW
jgi:hypothetical protein